MTAFLKDYANLAVVLVGISALVLLIYPNWRWTMVAMGIQYLAVAWLVSLNWPPGLAAATLVGGWVAGALLWTPQAVLQRRSEPFSGRLFRVIAACLVLIVIITLPPLVRSWLQVDQSVLLGGLILAGMGLLQTSMSHEPLRMVVGLLSFLAGFEIIYSALEVSVLVAGLLAAINLGLALAGAYLLSAPEITEAG